MNKSQIGKLFVIAVTTLLLLGPLTGLTQGNEERKILFVQNKVEILVPSELQDMTEEMFKEKYRLKQRPDLLLSDEQGKVILLAERIKKKLKENDMENYVTEQLDIYKRRIKGFEIISNGVKDVNGNKTGYIKFYSKGDGVQKGFNYFNFTIVDGKVLTISFNCLEESVKVWEPEADRILGSLKIVK